MTAFALGAGELHAAAEWTTRATPTKSPIPTLTGLLIDATDDAVTLSGFDYERAAKVTVDATVKEPGRMLVSARLLASVTATAGKHDQLTVDTSSGSAVVTAGRAVWTLPLMPVEDYPDLPEVGEVVGRVGVGELREALARVLPAAARDSPGAEMLTAVKIDTTGEVMTLAATDRFRLAVATITWEAGAGGLDALVPAGLLEIATKAADSHTSSFAVSVGQRNRLFALTTDTHTVSGAQMAATFPTYRRLIPTRSDTYFSVQTAELARAIKQVVPAMDGAQQLILQVAADHMTVSTSGATHQAARVDISAEATQDVTLAFNERYLRDALDVCRADTIHAHFTTPLRPVLLFGDDPDTYLHLLMPIRHAA